MTRTGLLDRLKSTEGPDRDIDADIAIRCGLITDRQWWSTDYLKYGLVPNYTGSVDHSLALCDQVLKVCRIDLCIDPSGIGAEITWWPSGLSADEEITVKYVTTWPEKAILVCLLRALEEKESAA